MAKTDKVKAEPKESSSVVKKENTAKPIIVENKVEKAEILEETKSTGDKKTSLVNEVEILSPTKKLKKIKGYSKKELEEFKVVVLQKREEILEQIQNLKEQMMDPTTGQYVNENSPYSLHMAEQGTDAQEREKLYLWAQRENKFLGYLDNALLRIDAGTFGICAECIDEPMNLCPTCPLVPKDRLLAVPHTQHCLQVKQKMQAK